MNKEVFINEKDIVTFTSDKVRLREHKKTCAEFFDQYHLYYLCKHCGKTYNDPSDGRVTRVMKNIRALRDDSETKPKLTLAKTMSN